MSWIILVLSFFGSAFIFAAVPAERLIHLKKGINHTNWLVYEMKVPEKEYLEQVRAESSHIQSLGFDHIRLGIDPFLADKSPELYKRVDKTVELILAQKLAVIVDVHPAINFENFTTRLAQKKKEKERFISFWRKLSKVLAKQDPNRVFFGILNEPSLKDRKQWSDLQSQLAGVIRRESSNHTLIATATNFSSVEELVQMEPIKDNNVIYEFHFYSPGVFTHQGTHWAIPYYRHLKNVPYPFGKKHHPQILNQIPREDQARFQERFASVEWDAVQIEKVLGEARGWGQKFNVPVLCTEFGVHKPGIPVPDRLRWIQDVRKALEKFGIGWTYWSYQGNFGLIDEIQQSANTETLQALGLKK